MNRPSFWSPSVLGLSLLIGAGVSSAFKHEPAPKIIDSSEEAIQRALAERGDFEFVEKPLSDVIDELRRRYNINLMINQRALDDEGVPAEQPI
ncbi:MAG: hypothetical protein N2C14_12895, partial [Planctomycetales bacterium]